VSPVAAKLRCLVSDESSSLVTAVIVNYFKVTLIALEFSAFCKEGIFLIVVVTGAI